MLLKVGVSLNGLNPIMRQALGLIDHWFEAQGFEDGAIVTSTTDGEHSSISWHYYGLAFDVRTRHLNTNQRRALEAYAKVELAEFDSVLEQTHLHVEIGNELAKQIGVHYDL